MGKLTKTSISFMNFNGIWGNFDRHGLWTFTTHEDVVRPWASILMPAGSLDVISNKFYPRLRNRIGYRAECWKHWNLTRVFILRPSEKHVGIIRQQCLLIFVKKITWIFNFFIINPNCKYRFCAQKKFFALKCFTCRIAPKCECSPDRGLSPLLRPISSPMRGQTQNFALVRFNFGVAWNSVSNEPNIVV